MWQYPQLIGLLRRLIGDELYASAIWNGRPRAPRQSIQTVDWHQDAHYMQDYDPLADRLIGVWLPLVPVDEHSGCLQVIPGSHRNGLRPAVRLERNNLVGLADRELAGQQPVSCSMTPGDVLLFTELLYHRSKENRSLRTRWSLDVRYFDATNEALPIKENQRYRGTGYYCYSGADPRRVTPFAAWPQPTTTTENSSQVAVDLAEPGQPYPSALQPVGCFGPLGEVLPRTQPLAPTIRCSWRSAASPSASSYSATHGDMTGAVSLRAMPCATAASTSMNGLRVAGGSDVRSRASADRRPMRLPQPHIGIGERSIHLSGTLGRRVGFQVDLYAFGERVEHLRSRWLQCWSNNRRDDRDYLGTRHRRA